MGFKLLWYLVGGLVYDVVIDDINWLSVVLIECYRFMWLILNIFIFVLGVVLMNFSLDFGKCWFNRGENDVIVIV